MQMAQIVHAVIDYCNKHDYREWKEISNYVAVLCAKDEHHLNNILEKANKHSLNTGYFLEPDLNNQLTAIVLQPGELSKKLCSNLPLLR